MAYGVWIQGIDDRTSAANVEQYGQYQEFDDMYAEGFSKEFCDGQTSPTGPRYADDEMGMLWVPDEDTARFLQSILREDISSRVATEGLKLAASPSWFTAGQATSSAITAELLTNSVDDIAAMAPEGINAGQVQTAVNKAVEAGAETTKAIVEHVKDNARWWNA